MKTKQKERCFGTRNDSVLKTAYCVSTHYIDFKKKEDNNMYDSFIYCEEYKELKDRILEIYNGEADCENIDKLAEHIHELYADEKMSGTQYDDLIQYVQDIMLQF